VLANNRKRYWANPEKARTQSRGYQKRDPDHAAKKKKWAKAHYDRNRLRIRKEELEKYWADPSWYREQKRKDYRKHRIERLAKERARRDSEEYRSSRRERLKKWRSWLLYDERNRGWIHSIKKEYGSEVLKDEFLMKLLEARRDYRRKHWTGPMYD
jgi:hypothetical protein